MDKGMAISTCVTGIYYPFIYIYIYSSSVYVIYSPHSFTLISTFVRPYIHVYLHVFTLLSLLLRTYRDIPLSSQVREEATAPL